jgi:hypothetical protein
MAAESSRPRDGRGRKEVDVDELLRNLNLHGEELNDVVLAKEEVRRWPEVKWLAAARVLTRKPFSMLALKNTMMAPWGPAHEVSFSESGAKLVCPSSFLFG